MLEAESEAKDKSSRPRPRTKFWPRGQLGLEDLTSLLITTSHVIPSFSSPASSTDSRFSSLPSVPRFQDISVVLQSPVSSSKPLTNSHKLSVSALLQPLLNCPQNCHLLVTLHVAVLTV